MNYRYRAMTQDGQKLQGIIDANDERQARLRLPRFNQSQKNALDMYKLDNHHYPTTNQGLESLVEAPTLPPLAANYNKEGYIKRLPADPWGNDYVLVNPGEHGAYDLLSAGPDGEMGTEDDITNWGLSKKKK